MPKRKKLPVKATGNKTLAFLSESFTGAAVGMLSETAIGFVGSKALDAFVPGLMESVFGDENAEIANKLSEIQERLDTVLDAIRAAHTDIFETSFYDNAGTIKAGYRWVTGSVASYRQIPGNSEKSFTQYLDEWVPEHVVIDEASEVAFDVAAAVEAIHSVLVARDGAGNYKYYKCLADDLFDKPLAAVCSYISERLNALNVMFVEASAVFEVLRLQKGVTQEVSTYASASIKEILDHLCEQANGITAHFGNLPEIQRARLSHGQEFRVRCVAGGAWLVFADDGTIRLTDQWQDASRFAFLKAEDKILLRKPVRGGSNFQFGRLVTPEDVNREGCSWKSSDEFLGAAHARVRNTVHINEKAYMACNLVANGREDKSVDNFYGKGWCRYSPTKTDHPCHMWVFDLPEPSRTPRPFVDGAVIALHRADAGFMRVTGTTVVSGGESLTTPPGPQARFRLRDAGNGLFSLFHELDAAQVYMTADGQVRSTKSELAWQDADQVLFEPREAGDGKWALYYLVAGRFLRINNAGVVDASVVRTSAADLPPTFGWERFSVVEVSADD